MENRVNLNEIDFLKRCARNNRIAIYQFGLKLYFMLDAGDAVVDDEK